MRAAAYSGIASAASEGLRLAGLAADEADSPWVPLPRALHAAIAPARAGGAYRRPTRMGLRCLQATYA